MGSVLSFSHLFYSPLVFFSSLHLVEPLVPVGVDGSSWVSIIIVLISLLPTPKFHHAYAFEMWLLVIFVEAQRLLY